MGLLDNNNMEYFKNKLFGYSDEDLIPEGTGSFHIAPADQIWMRHNNTSRQNKDLSYWDMIKDGNIAGPFRRNYPLEQPEGALDRHMIRERANYDYEMRTGDDQFGKNKWYKDNY